MFRIRKWQVLDLLLVAGIALLVGRTLRQQGADAPMSGPAPADPTPPAPSTVSVETGLPRGSASQAVIRARPVSLESRDRPFVASEPVATVNTLLREDRWERLPSLPAMELADVGESFELTVSMSGLQPDQLHLRLDGAVLSVLAPRTSGNGGLGLMRRVMLPMPVDDSTPPTCYLTNGVLRIRVAKRH